MIFPKEKRINTGGVIPTVDGKDISFNVGLNSLLFTLFSSIGLLEYYDKTTEEMFLNDLTNFFKVSGIKVYVPNKISNTLIISRLYYCNKTKSNREWQPIQEGIIENALISGTTKQIRNHECLQSINSRDLKKKIGEITQKITNRPWSQEEIRFISMYVQKQISKPFLKRKIHGRTIESLDEKISEESRRIKDIQANINNNTYGEYINYMS